MYQASFTKEDFDSEEFQHRMKVETFKLSIEVCRKAMLKAGALPRDPVAQERALRYEVERAGAIYYSPEIIQAVEDQESQEITALYRYLVEEGIVSRDWATAYEQLSGMLKSAKDLGEEGDQRFRQYRMQAKKRYIPDYSGALEKWDPVRSLA